MSEYVRKNKVYGIRLKPEVIEDFQKACSDLPLVFKPNQLLEAYINHIILSAKEYKNTGKCNLNYYSNDGGVILYNKNLKQLAIEVES